jgi:hypothetical protein
MVCFCFFERWDSNHEAKKKNVLHKSHILGETSQSEKLKQEIPVGRVGKWGEFMSFGLMNNMSFAS